jgi:hypothetical protein
MSDKPLKLKARDAEDVQVISAVLQDSIAPVVDMMFNAEDKNFIMVVHRMRHETKGALGLERICCAVNIQGVQAAQLQGINLNHQSQMLDLLAVMTDDQTMIFIFAGDAKIRLQLQDWSMIVEDFGAAWPAQCNPCHDEGSGYGVQGSAKN